MALITKIGWYIITVLMIAVWGWQCTVPGDDLIDAAVFGVWCLSLGMDIMADLIRQKLGLPTYE